MFRKSGKQRRAEIKAARLERAQKLVGTFNVYEHELPRGAVRADHAELSHVFAYGRPLPNCYMEKPFKCTDCGINEVWTAKQQKWWYEIAKGAIDSTAIRCRPCRKLERTRKAGARKVHLDGLARKHSEKSLSN